MIRSPKHGLGSTGRTSHLEIGELGPLTSAEGTLSVHDALRVFSLRTLVAAKETEINKTVVTEIVQEHKSSFLSTDFIL
ncbi:MAG: hypothetical protein MUP25_04160 [Syntrophales bacterium]|nr:hypothetical protein [Syntrophales bacterium]